MQLNKVSYRQHSTPFLVSDIASLNKTYFEVFQKTKILDTIQYNNTVLDCNCPCLS